LHGLAHPDPERIIRLQNHLSADANARVHCDALAASDGKKSRYCAIRSLAVPCLHPDAGLKRSSAARAPLPHRPFAGIA